MTKLVLPNSMVEIHMYACIVILCIVPNLLDIIPDVLNESAKEISNYLTKPLMYMCGIGIAFTDLCDLLMTINLQTIFISFMVVLGAIIGSSFVRMLFGFNFVEGAITPGLYVANRGGSGDLQVLSAGKRLNLMSFARISSRIGGAIVLILGSIVFGMIAGM